MRPLAKKLQNCIVDRSTARNFMVSLVEKQEKNTVNWAALETLMNAKSTAKQDSRKENMYN